MAEATSPRDIKTAVSESAEQAVSGAAPAVSSVSAEGLKMLVEDREMRRSYIIPSLDGVKVAEAETWESIKPENYTELRGKAVLKTNELAKALFGCETADTPVDFSYYTDTSQNRGDFVKAAAKDDSIVCVLAADTLDLIEIDYYSVPALLPEQDSNIIHYEISDNDRRIADKIAASFNTGVTDITLSAGALHATKTFSLTMKNGKFVKFATIYDELYAVAVYPTEACMTENVYFEADIRFDSSAVRLASPQNFVIGEPGGGDMTRDEALSIYGKFLDSANGTGKYPEPAAAFYIDNSGTRDNYWHLESEKLTMNIASKNRCLVSLECGGLWNPEHDLTNIPYESMGGNEYEEYVRNIMSGIYGDSLAEVTANDVYADKYCTENAVMADGTIYVFVFEGGKLTEVRYYFDYHHLREWSPGWKADHVYINSITGKEYIPG